MSTNGNYKNDSDRNEESVARVQFWSKVAAAVFGLWASTILIGIGILDSSLTKYVDQQKECFTDIVELDKRLSLFEERQNRVMEYLGINRRKETNP